MDIIDRIQAIIPRASRADIARYVEGGVAYADRLDKLPAREREAVCQLFALFALAPDNHYKLYYRRAIDHLIAPFYPAVEVQHADPAA